MHTPAPVSSIVIVLALAGAPALAQDRQAALSPRMERGRREVLFQAEPGAMPANRAGPLALGGAYVGGPLRSTMQRLGARSIRRAVPSWEAFIERYPFARVQQLRRGEQVDPGALTDLSLLFVLELEDSSQVRAAVAALRTTPGVLYAHANATVGVSAAVPARPFVARRARPAGFRLFPHGAVSLMRYDLLPNDPDFVNGDNWGFHNALDQNADVQGPSAWGLQTGNASVRIGVLDTGIDSLHTDMRSGSLFKVFRQYDFVHDDNNAYPDGSADNPSHGQQAAGIAGGHTNDGFGSAGLCGGNGVLSPGCSIIAAKILGDGSWINGIANWLGLESDAADAVIWTANQGALVESNSWCHYRGFWGGENYSVHQAMRDVAQVGILTTAAMGNSDGTCNQSAPDQSVAPAAFSDIVMAVGAVDRFGFRVTTANFSWESATGPHISVVAPSPGHFSGRLGNVTGPFSGTSAATPFVSGLAGLLWAEIQARGYALYGYDVRRLIELTARDREAPGWDANTGHGLIDGHRALSALQPPNTLTLNAASSTTSTCTSLTDWTNWAWWASFTVSVVRRCEVRRTITFPAYITPPLVWGRPVAGGGSTPSNPNSEVYYTGVVNGTVTTTSAVLKTYVYQRTNGSWWPAAPQNVNFGYAILGQVQPPPMFYVYASAPGYVTQKAAYALEGSANAPANNWLWEQSYDGGPYGFWSNSQNSQFIAYGGQYTLGWRLTANRSFDGAPGSDETQTIVCIPAGPGCTPLAPRPEAGITFTPPAGLSAAAQPRVVQLSEPRSPGGIFGSGVWVSREAPAESTAAMLYSLAGNHDAWSDSATWPNALRLGAVSTRSVADLGLAVVEQVAGIRSGTAATIRVTGARDRAGLRVSYAVDPDLGASPHDDALRWIESIAVAVVEDAETGAHAYGWAGDADALRATLREYGQGTAEPETRAQAYRDQREGTRVLGVRGDVRFALTLPAMTAPAAGLTLTFLQTEAPTAGAAVQALLDARVARLSRMDETGVRPPGLAVRQFYGTSASGFSRVGAVRASLRGAGATAEDAQRVRAQGITAVLMSVEQTGGDAGLEILVLDLRGRVVRRVHFGVAQSGTYVFQWDRRNDRGDRVAPGVYRAVVRHGSEVQRTALVVTN